MHIGLIGANQNKKLRVLYPLKMLHTGCSTNDAITLIAQIMKFSIKGFFGKFDQIRRFLMENFIFCAVTASFTEHLKLQKKLTFHM